MVVIEQQSPLLSIDNDKINKDVLHFKSMFCIKKFKTLTFLMPKITKITAILSKTFN